MRPGIYQCSKGRPFSWAEKSGFFALASAALLALTAPVFFPVPLILYILACSLAPVFPSCSFFYPVISHGRRDLQEISLSFDDGPDPLTTPLLLDLLRQYGFRATFFVNGGKVRRYPALVEAIIKEGHELGNQSYSHDPCIMFQSPQRILQEITLTQRALARHGVQPVFFRPPVGINVPAYAEALHQTGLQALTFSCRARDMGNRRIAGLSRRILRTLQAGDIIILHDVAPLAGARNTALWQAELEHLFTAIETRHLSVVPLSILCGLPGIKALKHDELHA